MNRKKAKSQFIAYIICSVIITAITVNPATAAITTTGDIDPIYPGLDPWIISGDLTIGDTSDGSMIISDGSMVFDANGIVGLWPDSTSSVTVTGSNSRWGNTNLLIIGEGGDANMVISDGALVTSTYSRIAYWADSTSNVTVTGPNSTWEGGQFLFGNLGDAHLTISDGGKVTNTYGSVASMPDSISTVDVTGPNSLWEIQGNLSLGTNGGDANMVISNGGRVIDANAYVGYDSSGTDHVRIIGSDSVWDNTNNLYVGYDGSANLLITDGGKVTDANGYTSYNSTSTGNATVTGSNSLWESSNNLYIGYSGNSILDISDGGQVTNSSGYIGYNTDGTGTLNITDTNSLWESLNDLYAGYSGIADVNISNGSRVINTNGYVAYEPNSEGTVTITGPNTLWESTQNFYAGYGGNADMVITDGGKIMDANGHIGYQEGGFGSISITGTNSLWENSDSFFAGYSGDANMVISNGGSLISTNGYIGYNPTATGNMTITGPNSLWNNSNNLYIGYAGNANVIITDEGKILNANAYIGYEPNSVSIMRVDGPNSLWENSGDLYVGYNGNADLTIANGGQVINSFGYISSEPNSVGKVLVNGPNTIWINTDDLYIGCSHSTLGGTDLLFISDGGTVEANEVTIWKTGIISGDGTLISDSVTNYGKIAVGTITTPMTIEGNLTMNPNSVLEVEVDNSGNSDLLIVTGDVNIVGGSVKPISLETISGWKEYTIVEANNITGTFNSIDTALLDTIVMDPHTELGYDVNGHDADSIILKIGARRFDDPSIAQTDNQKSVGRALQNIADNGGNSVTSLLQSLETAGKIRSSYDQLCGQTRPQLAPVTIADTSKFMSTISDRLLHASPSLSNSFSNSPAFAMSGPDSFDVNTKIYDTGLDSYMFTLGNSTRDIAEQKWGIWSKGYGLLGDRKSKNGVPGYKYNVYGTSLGIDYKYTERSLFGLTAGFSNSDVDYTLSGSKGEISGKHIGFYNRSNVTDWFFDYILMYSKLEYETERDISLTGETADGSFNGQAISGYMEARYDWRSHISWFIQPLASLQFSLLNLDGYTESGSSSNLTFEEQSYKSLKGSVGVRVKNNLYADAEGRYASVELRGRLLHEFGDTDSSIGASFAGNPKSGFQVSDEAMPRDSVVLGFGFSGKPSRSLRLLFDYDISFNADETAHLISAALEYRR